MRFGTRTLRAALLGATLLAAQAAPALAATWIPGHHNAAGYWIPGHWVGGPGVWVVGHVDGYGHWIPGHWAGGFGPAPGVYEGPPGPPAYGYHWVGGCYGPGGLWHRGHWAPN
jgi:hypothetical protein